MNIQITQWLNSFLYKSELFDQAVYALAEYSIFVVAIIFVLAFVSWIKLQPFLILRGATTALGAWLISQGINILTAIERPFVKLSDITPLFMHGLNDSFPSGHGTIMFVLAFYAYRQRPTIGLVLLILGILSSAARVMAGIHYPMDIFGSIILAYIGVLLVEWLYGKFWNK